MVERLREVRISLDDSDMIVEFNQGNMDENEFFYAVINYVLSNINVEVIE